MAEPSNRRRGRPSIDWSDACSYWMGLPADQRSYQAVADRYGISVRTVERHGRKERWRERRREIEASADRAVAEQLAAARAEHQEGVLKLVDATYVLYARGLSSGTVKVTPSDLVRLHKLRTELEGKAADLEAGAAAVATRTGPRDETERRLQVLRALHEVGDLDRLLGRAGSASPDGTH